jgi:bla regulator protein blaR1
MIEWLTDTLLATSGLILLVLILREPVRRRFGPSVAYCLWLLPAARLVMPTMTWTVERVVPAATEPPLTFAALPATAAATAPAPTLVEQLGGWPTILVALWLSVAAVMLAAGTLTYLRQRRAVLGEGVQLARLGSIRIVRSEAITGPMAFGLLDRIIAIPADFEIRYDERQRRLALDHELAHHASGDLWVNLIAFVLLCLQWFNPLAWVAHTAFRFDQEAACDARVLDKVDGPDRAAYGQAIAKAASGRVLLFAGALDRPKTLSRRLNSMLISSNPRRRLAGKVLIAATAAVALPLTATWATLYVDTVAPVRPIPPISPIVPVAALAAAHPPAAADSVAAPDPVAAVTPVAAVEPASQVVRPRVVTKGKEMHWDTMTPAEREELRADLREARRDIERGRAETARALAEARAELSTDLEESLAEARRDLAETLRDIDSNAAELRRAGQDPEAIKAQVRASLRGLDARAIKRHALAGINEHTISASMHGAEVAIVRMEAELDRLDRQDRHRR